MASEQDVALTLDAVDKILGLMKAGDLDPTLSITRYPIQVVVASGRGSFTPDFPSESLAILQEVFPGGSIEVKHRAVGAKTIRSKHAKVVFDSADWTHLLREPVQSASRFHQDRPPRIEVWGIRTPHTCGAFVGYLDPSGKPRWRCGYAGCRKALGIRAAREEGLAP